MSFLKKNIQWLKIVTIALLGTALLTACSGKTNTDWAGPMPASVSNLNRAKPDPAPQIAATASPAPSLPVPQSRPSLPVADLNADAGELSYTDAPPYAGSAQGKPAPLKPVQYTGSEDVTPDLKSGVTEAVFAGSGRFTRASYTKPAESSPSETGNAPVADTTLNFVNTDIHEVAKAVLGDMLGLNYTVAPGVQGAVTVKLNHALPREAVLPTLDTIFRMNGAAIVNSNGIVRVVPVAEAPKQALPINSSSGEKGFGMQVVTLNYLSTDEIQKLLAPVANQGSLVPVETAQNVLIITGTQEERSSMLNLISTFDVDWLSGMSFALFPMKEANARDVVREVWEVLGTQSGPLGKVIRLVPFDRLNAVLVITSQPKYLSKIKTWITRLDVDQAPSDQKIWVYSVQNGRATDLAGTLNKLIGGGRDQPAGKAPKQPIPPPPPPIAFNDLTSATQTAPAPEQQPGETQDQGNGPKVIADDTTNSLIIKGTKAQFAVIEAALKKLDIVPLQVRIEAVVAEVTLTDDLNYGVQYLFSHKHLTSVLTDASNVSVSPALPGFSAFVTSSHINTVLDLLRSITDVHVISSPQLMVLNNQTATLQVGDEVPIATGSAVSTLTSGAPIVNSIEMKDTGVILKVTPRVNASGMVLMDIAQEVSDVSQTTTSTLDSPTISERKITSSVAVRDGETIALGGLIKDTTTNSKTGIPVLQDIPVVGALFGDNGVNKERTELLALITPRVVKSDKDVYEVTEDMREQMQAVLPLDAKVHQSYPE
jgi:general secretion pathway protein D